MKKKDIIVPITASGVSAVKTQIEGNDSDIPGATYLYGIYTEDATDFELFDNSSGSAPTKIPFGTTNLAPNLPIQVDEDGTICYAKGTTSTNLIVLRGEKV